MGRLVDRAPFTALGLLWPGRPLSAPRPPGSGRAVRLVTANALRTNKHPERWAAAVVGLAPEVLCVAELTPEIDAALRQAGVDDALPHACRAVREGSAGTGLWSRAPMADAAVHDGGYAVVSGRVDGVTYAAIHTVAPTAPRNERRWLRSFEVISSFVDSVDGPVVVAGDWNATLAHGPLRALLSTGRLRDAHTDAGRWRARTWPAYAPVAGLDRVLVSDDVGVRSIAEHRAKGSDHLAVVAELVVCADG